MVVAKVKTPYFYAIIARMTEAPKEAERVVLSPEDVSQLHALNFEVTHSVIGPGFIKDEKRELQGALLRKDGRVLIEYFFSYRNGARRRAEVTYKVEEAQPPGSRVGQGTEVEILAERAERQDGQFGFSIDQTYRDLIAEQRESFGIAMKEELAFWKEELRLVREAGFPPINFAEVKIGLLEESLTGFF